MKKIIMLLAITFLCIQVNAQSNVVLFSENGEWFFLSVNGVGQNEIAKSNVKVTGLKEEFIQATIAFQDKSLGEFKKNVMLQPGKEVTYMIAKKGNGKWTLKFRGEVPLSEVPEEMPVVNTPPPPVQGGEEKPVPASNPASPASSQDKANVNVSTEGNEETVNTTTDINGNGSSVAVSMSDDKGNSVNVNINVDGMTEETKVTEQKSQQQEVTTQTNNSDRYFPDGTMCPFASMTAKDFLNFKYEVEKQSAFSRKKYVQEKISANCMLSTQVAELVKMEASYNQLELAKYAYKYTYDTKNYDVVVKALKNDYDRPKLVNFIGVDGAGENATPTYVESEEPVEEVYVEPVATDGCLGSMSSSAYEQAKKTITSKSFSDEKLIVAKQVIKNNCMTVAQVRGIIKLFDFSEEKMAVAKYAYEYTSNQSDYYQVNDEFTFSDDVEELNRFLENK